MESKNIVEILKKLEADISYKKIFINGKWGIGKSFYTNEYVKDKDNTAYITLFGRNNINIIEEEIARQLLKKIKSKKKYLRWAKEILKKVKGSISYNGFSISSPELKSKSFIEEYQSILKDEENLIVIIDDLERKSSKVAIEDILGIIEQLSLLENVKIVLIGDENKINENDLTIWNSFKEKIIDKEYKISKFSNEAIYSLVTSKISKYLEQEKIESFINEFLENFSINNLRTINKGVNLFLEIVNKHLYKEYKDAYLIILKTCMAVAVEKMEKLFEPKEKPDNENYDFSKELSRKIDEDIETRIERYYFNSALILKKDARMVHYILHIFDGEYNYNLIDEFNKVIEEYLNTQNEKNIFYLDEKNIKRIIKNNYNAIIKNEYVYTCLDEFIDDIYNILDWSNTFNIEVNENKFKEQFKNILFENYYNSNKSLYENTIDKFELKYENCSNIEEYVDEYNKNAEEKYSLEKIEKIEGTFKNKEYNINYLRWVDNAFIQADKEEQFERFISKARENNYFISDLNGEISDEEWRWIHYIWNVFYKYMEQEHKDELENYIDTLKGKSILQDKRIGILQEYKPLVKK